MAMCTDSDHMDIPVPDFAFEDYPDTGYVSQCVLGVEPRLRESVRAGGGTQAT